MLKVILIEAQRTPKVIQPLQHSIPPPAHAIQQPLLWTKCAPSHVPPFCSTASAKLLHGRTLGAPQAITDTAMATERAGKSVANGMESSRETQLNRLVPIAEKACGKTSVRQDKKFTAEGKQRSIQEKHASAHPSEQAANAHKALAAPVKKASTQRVTVTRRGGQKLGGHAAVLSVPSEEGQRYVGRKVEKDFEGKVYSGRRTDFSFCDARLTVVVKLHLQLRLHAREMSKLGIVSDRENAETSNCLRINGWFDGQPCCHTVPCDSFQAVAPHQLETIQPAESHLFHSNGF